MFFGVMAAVVLVSSLAWLNMSDDRTSGLAVEPHQAIFQESGAVKENLEEQLHTVTQMQDVTEAAIADPAVEDNSTFGFEQLFPVTIGEMEMQASLATTASDRTKGLSKTSSLPEGVIKLFVFDGLGQRGFWMKDMLYPIDIIWLDDVGRVIHFEAEVSPDTYPKIFYSPDPAMYVIEAKAGFIERERVQVGTIVNMPPQAIAAM